MKNNLMTIALLTTGAAFSLALAAAAPKLSKALIPIGAALGGASVAVVMVGEGDGDRVTNTLPTADYPPPPPSPPSPASPPSPVADRPQSPIFGSPLPPPSPPELMAGTIICVGAQGSGKSSSAARILHQRVSAGARGIVLNHHAEYGQYAGLEIWGRGENYQDRFLSLEAGMRKIIGELDHRYHRLQTERNPIFQPIAILMDEMSSWKGGISQKLGEQFIKLCLTDTRKAKITTIWATHNLTKECWCGVDGVSFLVRNSGTILWLSPSPDGSGDMQSSGYGEVEVQGKKRRVKLADFLPKISGDIWDFSQYQSPQVSPDIQSLERLYSISSDEIVSRDWQVILDYLQTREIESAKVRDLQQSRIPRGGIKADELRVILQEMAEANLIEFDGNQAVLARP